MADTSKKLPAARGRWAPGAVPLCDAAKAVSSIVFAGRSAEDAMAPFEGSPQRSAIRAITLGTVRWYLRLAPAIETLLARPQDIAPQIRALLVAGAHQIVYSRNAAPATVHAAVDAARVLRIPSAAGLVNAVLRRFATQHCLLLARGDEVVATRTAHPRWLVSEIEQAWPGRSEEILAANNEHPPMVLRVDLTRRSVESYLAQLHAAGVGARSVPWAAAAVQLEKPIAVSALPGFEGDVGERFTAAGTDTAPTPREGAVVSVQDSGAQLVPSLLEARPGMRVLDACAAPGGKTGHLLEHTPELEALVAVDIDPDRVSRIRENLHRLQRSALTATADIRDPGAFWDGRPFDRILVDAPCSSTGVIRRHPDIKLLRRPEDIPVFANTQFAILQSAFRLLAPGGRLLYSTCSVLPAENEAVVRRLLNCEASARAARMPPAEEIAPGALERGLGIQLLPGAEAGADGFYYACLEKTTVGT